ncbi:MAG: hypothetical protein ABFS14_10755 [Gemmatimonadota bacterium]
MKRLTSPIFLLAVLVSASCGGDATGPGGISISDIAGTWNAASMVFAETGTTGLEVTVDPIADGGTAVLTIQSNGQFTLQADFPLDGSSSSSSGTMHFDEEDEDFLLLLFDGETVEDEFFFQLNGNAMSLNGVTEFDFDGDGVEEEAGLIAAFVRSS